MKRKSVVVWAAFSHYGKSRVAALNGKQKAEVYYSVLMKRLHLMMIVYVQNSCDVLFQ